jgi:ABC-type sulfate transport system permease component
MVIIVAVGTPVAAYIARCRMRERLLWQAVLLVPILLPPLALGILLTLAYGPYGTVGAWLEHFGVVMTNSATAFVSTQVYVGMGYYVLGAVATFDAVPPMLQKQAALLGLTPWKVFWRVTLPLSRLGLAVALSIAWVRAIGEFGAVVVTAYYPSGIPVQLWVNLQSFGLPAGRCPAASLASACPGPAPTPCLEFKLSKNAETSRSMSRWSWNQAALWGCSGRPAREKARSLPVLLESRNLMTAM